MFARSPAGSRRLPPLRSIGVPVCVSVRPARVEAIGLDPRLSLAIAADLITEAIGADAVTSGPTRVGIEALDAGNRSRRSTAFFRPNYGPTVKASAALDESQRQALYDDFVGLVRRHDCRNDSALVVPSTTSR